MANEKKKDKTPIISKLYSICSKVKSFPQKAFIQNKYAAIKANIGQKINKTLFESRIINIDLFSNFNASAINWSLPLNAVWLGPTLLWTNDNVFLSTNVMAAITIVSINIKIIVKIKKEIKYSNHCLVINKLLLKTVLDVFKLKFSYIVYFFLSKKIKIKT